MIQRGMFQTGFFFLIVATLKHHCGKRGIRCAEIKLRTERRAGEMLAGIEPRFINWVGDSAVLYVLSKNLHRRHLTTSQMPAIALLRGLRLLRFRRPDVGWHLAGERFQEC